MPSTCATVTLTRRSQADLRDHPERFFRSYLCSGVTAVFDVGGYLWTSALRGARRDGLPRAARRGRRAAAVDAGTSGSTSRRRGSSSTSRTRRPRARVCATWPPSVADAVKVWFIDVEDGRSTRWPRVVTAAATRRTRRAAADRPRHRPREAKAALRGRRHAAGPRRRRPAGGRRVPEPRAAPTATIYCPTLTVRGGYLRMFESAGSASAPSWTIPTAASTPRRCAEIAETPGGRGKVDAGANPKRRPPAPIARAVVQAANLRSAFGAGIPIAMGTDAGNPLTLHGPSVYAEMEAMQAAGLTPMEVLVASTRGASLAMGAARRSGTLEKGKSADLHRRRRRPDPRHRQPSPASLRHARGRSPPAGRVARPRHRPMSGALPVAIAGAGPTGIACAVELGRRGIPAVCCDRGATARLHLPLPRRDALVLDARSARHRGRPFRLAGRRTRRGSRRSPTTAASPSASASACRAENLRSSGWSRAGRRTSSVSADDRRRRRSGSRRRRRFSRPGSSTTRAGSACRARGCRTSTARYVSGYPFHGRDVVVVGGKNSAAEAALDLYRHGARVTMVVRGRAISERVKYWIKPDLENRIAAGAIRAHFGSRVRSRSRADSVSRRGRRRAARGSRRGGFSPDRLRAGLRPLRALRHPARGRGPGPGARPGDPGVERPGPVPRRRDPRRPGDREDLHREQPAPRRA